MGLRSVLLEVLKFPLFHPLARRRYDRFFLKQRRGNHYRGIYPSYAEAMRHIPASLVSTFDNDAAASQYRHRVQQLRVSEYPALFWLSQLLDRGQRSIFDLGGHFGLFYYALRRPLSLPPDLRWTVCDLPSTVASGRAWANDHDPSRQLSFTERNDDASGHDVMLVLGALQYFDYPLQDLLARLERPPTHLIINMTPMHPSKDFHTVQNMGFCCVPYHVLAEPDFVAAMQACGYEVVDRWRSHERECHIPFAPDHDVNGYSGFYLRRTDAQTSA